MPDPSNPDLELRRWGPTSLFIVPGLEKAVFEERPVPHGTVHVEFYDSAKLNGERMVYVYTPPGFESGKQKYPVLYLLHGNGRLKPPGLGPAAPMSLWITSWLTEKSSR